MRKIKEVLRLKLEAKLKPIATKSKEHIVVAKDMGAIPNIRFAEIIINI